MNKIKNRLRGLFNKYTILLLFTYFVFGVGFSYAYFAYTYENTTTIVGNVVAIDATLEVQQVVGNNGKMVPMKNTALSNALNGTQHGGQAACVDANGNLSCQVYKITLNNTGSRLQHITGTIELYAKDGNGNVYNNLRWQELTNPTTVKTDSNVNRMGKSLLETNITLNTNESREWYIAVWISEMDYDQTNTDKGLFGGTVTFEVLGENFSNAPNLDTGNLLPVYYDNDDEVWRKADSTNQDNSWYDYGNKMWANAVIVEPSKKETYQTTVDVDDPIPESDIIAFYVWIPRYKYRVWNLNRQGITEDSTVDEKNTIYAYSAYTSGIDIQFEVFSSSTGNVECVYDTATAELETNLADNCYYNGSTTPIKTTDLNTDYTDAWYTHPAFTFGGEEKEGFWIGKFETSTETSSTCYTTPNENNCNNTNQNPKILPGVSSLRYQNVSNQFTTSKKFQGYLSSGIDAHMLTNLEWGAVAYLTHSRYGLCIDDEGTVTCAGVNKNNSSGFFTGRSGGAISGSEDLYLANVYPNDSTSQLDYNENGYYDYKGYKLDYTTGEPTTKDITKVASTTKNITGVYDMEGGDFERVMGNMVSSSNTFYPSNAGTSWNGNSTLDSKFYNSYSYGTNDRGGIAFNRGRLGDATAEPRTEYSDSRSFFVFNYDAWFVRGGDYGDGYSNVFTSSGMPGHYGSTWYLYPSFRSSLS